MNLRHAPAAFLLWAVWPIVPAADAQDMAVEAAVTACLSCHLTEDGALDMVGLDALADLPEEWPFLFEDAFDLDGDGVAGRIGHVAVDGRPMVAKYGRKLAAARLQDFALLAGAAHGIDLSAPGLAAQVAEALRARSPDPETPSAEALTAFEARGCTACHVTDTFESDGRSYMPLSDFLSHDLGDGPARTAPLWGCEACLTGPGHP